ncbi:MAG TPA: hypothetical protein PLR65_12835, partial [Anaerolineales bacterium]|nr:hypothetical protein [Anaerolineales bacterium]
MDRAPHPLFKRDLRAPAEIVFCAADIERAAGLTVGLVGLPDDLACKTCHFRGHLHEVFDGNFLTRTEIDWLGTVVFFGGGDDPIGGIFHV